jgi:hypothetical protein
MLSHPWTIRYNKNANPYSADNANELLSILITFFVQPELYRTSINEDGKLLRLDGTLRDIIVMTLG